MGNKHRCQDSVASIQETSHRKTERTDQSSRLAYFELERMTWTPC